MFGFRLDACASRANAKCARFFTAADDALRQTWAPFVRVRMNPPYGRKIAAFTRKAFEESGKKGALVVALVPARTDTRWWHDWVSGKADVVFLRGRLRYTNEKGEEGSSAPFPSALVLYRPDLDRLCNRGGDPVPTAGG